MHPVRSSLVVLRRLIWCRCAQVSGESSSFAGALHVRDAGAFAPSSGESLVSEGISSVEMKWEGKSSRGSRVVFRSVLGGYGAKVMISSEFRACVKEVVRSLWMVIVFRNKVP